MPDRRENNFLEAIRAFYRINTDGGNGDVVTLVQRTTLKRVKVMKPKHAMTTLLILLAAVTSAAASCGDEVGRVLAMNSPEVIIVPDEAASQFVSTSVTVAVDWKHIAQVLDDTSCVESFMVEYGRHKSQHRVSKRETVSATSLITPPMPAHATARDISLPDDCAVYEAAVVAVVENGLGGKVMARSAARRFWPAGHRTTLRAFPDAVVVSWPPHCAHSTADWRLETCRREGDDCSVRAIRSESPTHQTGLRPCSAYSFRVLSASDDVLWSFEDVKTLPRPEFDIRPGRRTMRVRVEQSGCEPGAEVRHWRVTACRHRPGDRGDTAIYGGGGSGDGSHAGDDSYDYYDEEGEAGGSDPDSCVHARRDVVVEEDGDGAVVELSGLEECSLYSLHITPTDEDGETLQPAEQFGTVYSTLCYDDGVGKGGSEADGGGDDSFWFTEAADGGGDGSDDVVRVSVVSGDSGPGSSAGQDVMSLYVLLVTGSMLAVFFVVFAAILVWHHCCKAAMAPPLAARPGDNPAKMISPCSASSPSSSASSTLARSKKAAMAVGVEEEDSAALLLAKS